MVQRDWAYYEEEYVKKERSSYDIAREGDTYPNKIRRELKQFGFALRNKREAQLAALRHGRHKHPTLGRELPEETKQKISESLKERNKDGSEENQ
jgi:hypothetical protein